MHIHSNINRPSSSIVGMLYENNWRKQFCRVGLKLLSDLQQLLVGRHHAEILLLLGSRHRLDDLVGDLPLSADVFLKGPDGLLSPVRQTQNNWLSPYCFFSPACLPCFNSVSMPGTGDAMQRSCSAIIHRTSVRIR